MNISFEGYENSAVTFEADESVEPGSLVSLSESFKVQAAQPGDSVIGVALTVRGGYASVQTRGIIRHACSADLSEGWANLSVDSSGNLSGDCEDGPLKLIIGIEETQSGNIATALL